MSFVNDHNITITITDNDALDAPANLEATPGIGEVTLSWERPPNAGGGAIHRYQLDIGDGNGFVDISGSDNDTTSHTVTGLVNDTAYTFQVRAVIDRADSGEGAAATVTATPSLGPPYVTQPIGAQTLIAHDAALTLTLTEYFADPRGQTLSFSVATALAETVVTPSVDGAVLTLTPGSEPGTGEVTVTATDEDSLEVSQTFTVTVTPSVAERIARVNAAVLPEVTRAMVSSTVGTISWRVEQAASGAPGATPTMNLAGQSTLYQALRSNSQALEDGTLDLVQVLGTSSFVLPLNAAGDGMDGGAGGFVLWGSGDWRNLSGGDRSAVEYDGRLVSGHLGIDARLRTEVLAGLAVSNSKGDFDYTDRTDGDAKSGDYETRLTSVNPYVGWSGRSGVGLWATAGYGWGVIEVDSELPGGVQTSDLTAKSVAAGVNARLLSADDLIAGGTTTLKLKGEASLARADVDSNHDQIRALKVEVRRVRLALEGGYAQRLASGRTLTRSLEVGLRQDGGDGETGAGVEVGGAVQFADPASGLSIEGRGRVLVAHDGDTDEWGLGGLVRLHPGTDKRGMSFSLSPTWGETAGGVQRLWDQAASADAALNPREPEARLDAELGYGFGVLSGDGLLTPYGGFSLTGEESRRYRLGSRLEIGSAFDVSLEADRRDGADAVADHRVMLRGELRF